MTSLVSQPTYSQSSLNDMIIETWKHHRDEQHPISGDYYYDQVTSGVYYNQTIGIVDEHFSDELQTELKKLSDLDVHRIITQAIKELFASIHGYSLMHRAEKENRFHWVFVK